MLIFSSFKLMSNHDILNYFFIQCRKLSYQGDLLKIVTYIVQIIWRIWEILLVFNIRCLLMLQISHRWEIRQVY